MSRLSVTSAPTADGTLRQGVPGRPHTGPYDTGRDGRRTAAARPQQHTTPGAPAPRRPPRYAASAA
ncbi:hypothetical protein [Streptomyces sp. NPDC054804]